MPALPGGNAKESKKTPGFQQEINDLEVLLSISNEIISVRNKRDILDRIHPRLKQLFQTEDIFICRFDPKHSTICPFLRSASEKRMNDTDYRNVLEGHFSTANQFFTSILNSTIPVYFSLDELCSWASPPSFAIRSRNAGIEASLSIPLHHGQELLGILTLWSEKKSGFTDRHRKLLQKVADQVSIILASISDEETIRQWEDDNKILLDISSQFSAILEKEELLPVLTAQLNKLGFYADVTIAKIDSNGKTFSRFLTDDNDPRSLDEEYPEMLIAHHPYPDGVFERALHSRKVVLFDLGEIMKKKSPPTYIEFLFRNGTRHMTGVSLRDHNEPIAALFLFSDKKLDFTPRQLQLVEGIASLLGITVANILAHERITKQLEEISRYKEQLEEEKLYLQEELSGTFYADIVGNSTEIKQVFRQLMQVASANTTVLLLGETGTGKELIARAIHHASPRKDKLLVKVNCAAMPTHLIESELFGHEKGSFTGATERRIGKFELAHEGTLFLDEIGEIPPELQAKLLRAIQEKEIERIGGKSPIKVNVRIVAATNRNLYQEVEKEKFRKDLYYRLNVFPIILPPLRERKDDIPALIDHFIQRYAKNNGKLINGISKKALKQAMAYHWPGNIRELEHLVERSVLTVAGPVIRELHLPNIKSPDQPDITQEAPLLTYEENEREHIIQVMNKCNGKVSGPGGAASVLRLKVSTLNSKIKKLGIRINKVYK